LIGLCNGKLIGLGKVKLIGSCNGNNDRIKQRKIDRIKQWKN
jgi:hypothetical protein